jgi:SAM-dependent methyltransferase
MTEWQQFFDSFAPHYDREVFTSNTAAEIPFLVTHLRPPPGGRILDIGCGTGRHSVGLAKLGYRLTGVDLSSGMLSQAEARARAASVTVELVQANAVVFARPDAFDTAICLCEGSLGLLAPEDDALERDVAIVRNICRSLRPGGRVVVTILNACRQIREYRDEDVASGRFDVVNLTEHHDPPPDLPAGTVWPEGLRERGYTPPEIRRVFMMAGFHNVNVYGGTAGNWGIRPPKLDEMELMVIAEKPASR